MQDQQGVEEHGNDSAELGIARLDAANALKQQGRYMDAERCNLDARRIAEELVKGDAFAVSPPTRRHVS